MRILLSLFLAAQVANAEFPQYTQRGFCNNDVDTGGHEDTLVRMCPASYIDGRNPREDLPNPRDISLLVSTGNSPVSSRWLSDLVWSWGQFLDHDIDLTEEQGEDIGIPIAEGDPFFEGAGCTRLPFKRSHFVEGDGYIDQVNSITAAIDGSNVYGSCDNEADWLREKRDGLMKTSGNGRLLPKNVGSPIGMAGAGDDEKFFVAGDIRANEQMGLTAMHTLFVREHNRLAEKIRLKHYPNQECDATCDDNVYGLARRIIGALIQCITYEEFLPALLGHEAPDIYDNGYYSGDDMPFQILNEFSTFAFRFGHSMVSDSLLHDLPLKDAFFKPEQITDEMVNKILTSFPFQMAQNIDCEVVPGLQQFLFGEPSGGLCFDLIAFNIRRGRDHGLPTLNDVRRDLHLAPHTSWDTVTNDPHLRARLKEAYGEYGVEDCDAWIGGLAEKPYRTSLVGEVNSLVLREQFKRLMVKDPYFYKRDDMLADEYMGGIIGPGEWTLCSLISRNTGGGLDPSRSCMFSHGRGGGWGDPHFKDWSGEDFDFHGECDLVLGSVPSFGNGLGLDVQIRTKHQVAYSYIEAAAIKIGDDTFELGSYGEWFLNGVEDPDIEEDANLSGYRLTVDEKSTKKKQIFNIHLTKESKVVISSYKQLVRVDWDISGADFDMFRDITGLMGSWGNGTHFARDGKTVLEDANEYGQEWQVRPDTDAMLFENKRWPQYPSKCFIPQVDEEVKRRLGATEITSELAQAACKHVKHDKTRDACVTDVIALQDLSIADETY